jgi:outer membrane protein
MSYPRSLGLAALLLAASPVAGQQVEVVAPVQLFRMAEQALSDGRSGDAETIYRALSRDPDSEIRSEARFRLGMILAQAGRLQEAALTLRTLLDEKPDAARVRIELARILALIGDEAAARRELRQAQAAGLPPEVALVVDQFAHALRARQPLGGSISFAVVPDSNINRATDRETLDTIIAPLDLSEDAREQSGIGVRLGTQGYARIPLAANLSLLPRLSGQAELYRQSQFNDISGSAVLGLDWVAGRRDRLRPSIAHTWRFYGGALYAETQSVATSWARALGATAQLDTSLTIARADYKSNDLQDGWLFDLSAAYERALDARSGVGISISASRQTARDPGYATVSGGTTVLYGREIGAVTLFANLGLGGGEGRDPRGRVVAGGGQVGESADDGGA